MRVQVRLPREALTAPLKADRLNDQYSLSLIKLPLGNPPRLEVFEFQRDGTAIYVNQDNVLRKAEGVSQKPHFEWSDVVNNNAAIRDIAAGESACVVCTRRGQVFCFVNGCVDAELLSDGLRVTVDHENRNEFSSISADQQLTKAVAENRMVKCRSLICEERRTLSHKRLRNISFESQRWRWPRMVRWWCRQTTAAC